jgi:hypothetical protein
MDVSGASPSDVSVRRGNSVAEMSMVVSAAG